MKPYKTKSVEEVPHNSLFELELEHNINKFQIGDIVSPWYSDSDDEYEIKKIRFDSNNNVIYDAENTNGHKMMFRKQEIS